MARRLPRFCSLSSWRLPPSCFCSVSVGFSINWYIHYAVFDHTRPPSANSVGALGIANPLPFWRLVDACVSLSLCRACPGSVCVGPCHVAALASRVVQRAASVDPAESATEQLCGGL